jgi:hypothetical protein
MKTNPIVGAAGLLALLALAAGAAGCSIHTEKGANGEDKNVQVDTPFGGVHVNTGQTTAADLGLPVYPGARIAPDRDDDKSADVHMGFGDWEMRVKIVNYSAADGQDKVVAFYKKALDRYGDVISCQDGAPVGTPTKTSQGLACDNKDQMNVTVGDRNVSTGNQSLNEKGFQLRSGSVRHQHIVAFESSAPGQTRFTLMAIDLPSFGAGGPKKSN